MVSICNYIEQYSSYYIHSLGASLGSPLTLEFICNNDISIEDINVKINLIRFNMVIENLINNSIKAHAKNISIEFSKDDTFIYITFIDNGVGLNSDISNPDAIFEQGYTTTKGTGLGLAHVKHTIETMKGNIKLNHIYGGFSLTVGIRYEH